MEDDIQIVEMRSLGRGRGFEVVSRESALDDPELTSTIAARLRVLLRLLDDEGTETRDVRGEKEEVASLRGEKEELEAQLAKSEEENEKLAALEATVENALRLLNNHLGEDFTDLEEAVEFLVENKG